MEHIEPGMQANQPDVIKVLIADDDPPTRMMLRAAISQWGYDVMEAKDGEEAWDVMQKMKDTPPRILILDWLMPKLDGVALAERIKQQSAQHPYIYIILLTQKTGTINIIKSLEAGADAFLSKPFDMTELRSRLSAGARMIKYDNQITEQNKQLHHYVTTIDKMELAIIQVKKIIGDLDKAPEKDYLKKIKEVNHEVDILLDTVVKIKNLSGNIIDE